MKILIVGGGIGGLTLASFLEKSNIDYVLIDKEKDWSKHGYSLGMWSNGRDILSKLGLSDKFDEAMVPYQKLNIKTFSGRTLKSYDLKNFKINYGQGYSHIHRRDLHQWLLSGVDSSKIKMNTTVSGLYEVHEGIQASYSNGTGEIFDLVVGADGVHSSIRKLYFADDIEKYINWRCWYAIPKNPIGMAHELTEYLEPGKFLNIFDEGNESLAIFSSIADHLTFDHLEGRVDRLRKMFEHNPLTEKILEGLIDEQIMPTDLAEVNMRKWTQGKVALLGDAAHSFEPFAGLGGSMAMEDAYILAGELMQVSNSYPISEALLSYEAKRHKRVAEARHVTWKMKTWATIKSPILHRLMNLIAPIVPTRYFVKNFVDLMNQKI